jgi:hypothetical protein
VTKLSRTNARAGFPANTTKLITPGNHQDLVDSVVFLDEAPVNVSNIAALRALTNLSNQQVVSILGASSPNDGGGGDFYIDTSDTTSVDNGGTIIVVSGSSNARAKRIAQNDLDVGWFGGNTQAAHDALPNSGGRLNLNASTYNLSSTVNITKPCTIRGIGGGTFRNQAAGVSDINTAVTRINFSANNLPAFRVLSNSVKFRDLRITCTTTPVAGSVGILTTGFFGGAITGTPGNQSAGTGGAIEGCCIDGFGIAIDQQSGSEWHITNNWIYAFHFGGIRINHCAQPDSGDQVVHGNWIYAGPNGTPTYGVKVESGGGVKFTQNKFNSDTLAGSNKFAYGIWYQLAASGSAKVDGSGNWGANVATSVGSITANSFENISTYGVFFDTSNGGNQMLYVPIVGNEFAIIGTRSIHIDGAYYIPITGNTISGTGIFINNSLGTLVGANIFADMRTPLVTLGANNYECRVDVPNLQSSNQNQPWVVDNSCSFLTNTNGSPVTFAENTTGRFKKRASVDHRYEAAIPSNSAKNTKLNLFTIYAPLASSLTFNFEFNGVLYTASGTANINEVYGDYTRLWSGAPNGPIAVKVIGTDICTVNGADATQSTASDPGISRIATIGGTIFSFGTDFSVPAYVLAGVNQPILKLVLWMRIESADTLHDTMQGTARLNCTKGNIILVAPGNF